MKLKWGHTSLERVLNWMTWVLIAWPQEDTDFQGKLVWYSKEELHCLKPNPKGYWQAEVKTDKISLSLQEHDSANTLVSDFLFWSALGNYESKLNWFWAPRFMVFCADTLQLLPTSLWKPIIIIIAWPASRLADFSSYYLAAQSFHVGSAGLWACSSRMCDSLGPKAPCLGAASLCRKGSSPKNTHNSRFLNSALRSLSLSGSPKLTSSTN